MAKPVFALISTKNRRNGILTLPMGQGSSLPTSSIRQRGLTHMSKMNTMTRTELLKALAAALAGDADTQAEEKTEKKNKHANAGKTLRDREEPKPEKPNKPVRWYDTHLPKDVPTDTGVVEGDGDWAKYCVTKRGGLRVYLQADLRTRKSVVDAYVKVLPQILAIEGDTHEDVMDELVEFDGQITVALQVVRVRETGKWICVVADSAYYKL